MTLAMPVATPRQWSKKARAELNACLRKLGWSQAELARRIDKNPTYLCRVLSGQVTSRVVWDLAWEAVAIAMAMSISKPVAVSASSDKNTQRVTDPRPSAVTPGPDRVLGCPDPSGPGL